MNENWCWPCDVCKPWWRKMFCFTACKEINDWLNEMEDKHESKSK